jgi:hypothetical protein
MRAEMRFFDSDDELGEHRHMQPLYLLRKVDSDETSGTVSCSMLKRSIWSEFSGAIVGSGRPKSSLQYFCRSLHNETATLRSKRGISSHFIRLHLVAKCNIT